MIHSISLYVYLWIHNWLFLMDLLGQNLVWQNTTRFPLENLYQFTAYIYHLLFISTPSYGFESILESLLYPSFYYAPFFCSKTTVLTKWLYSMFCLFIYLFIVLLRNELLYYLRGNYPTISPLPQKFISWTLKISNKKAIGILIRTALNI